VGMSPLLLLAVEARAAEWGAQLGAGAAVGGYSCVSDFDGLERYHWGASPFAFAAAEVGQAPIHVFLGVDSAPTFRYGGGACHVILATYAMATAGVWGGSEVVRVGPYASIGLASASVGIRVAVTPWWGSSVALKGVEIRTGWLLGDAWLVSAAYTVAWR
jgi:hypothetical protein